MAFSPIAFTAANYRDYKNNWIKAYEPGTTTPKEMATDSTLSTLIAKAEINKDGFIVSAGQALITPYIEDTYDLWMFPTEAEADTNDTSNALRLADNMRSADVSLINNLSQAYDFSSIALMLSSAIVFPVGKDLQVFDETTELHSNYKVTAAVTDLPLAAGLYALPLGSSFDPSLTTNQAINNNTFNNSNPRGNKLQVFAHRGMAFQFPENTMVACSASINLGVDGLELDAAVSSDGVTYLFHDETVDALTDGTGTFTALTSAYIDTLKFTSTVGTILVDEKIPRLIDVLTLARSHGTYVMLELKLITSNADIDLIISDIVASGMEHLVSLQSGNLTNVQYVRGVNSVINVGYITADPAFSAYIDSLVLLGNATVTAQHDMIFANQGIVKYARDRGVDLVAYTVNDNIFAKRIQKTGVNKIMSDRLTGEILR